MHKKVSITPNADFLDLPETALDFATNQAMHGNKTARQARESVCQNPTEAPLCLSLPCLSSSMLDIGHQAQERQITDAAVNLARFDKLQVVSCGPVQGGKNIRCELNLAWLPIGAFICSEQTPLAHATQKGPVKCTR
jgi:hypothetical protein